MDDECPCRQNPYRKGLDRRVWGIIITSQHKYFPLYLCDLLARFEGQ